VKFKAVETEIENNEIVLLMIVYFGGSVSLGRVFRSFGVGSVAWKLNFFFFFYHTQIKLSSFEFASF